MLHRTNHHDFNIQMQINGNKAIPLILFHDIQDFSMRSLSLSPGYEHTIELSLNGQNSTETFQNLPLADRKCRFENEVLEGSAFKVYSQDSCKYECQVSEVFRECQCMPWDFIHGNITGPECDIFGRTCFFHGMEKLSHDANIYCPHCIDDCNRMNYRTKIVESKVLSLSSAGLGNFCTKNGDYMCTNKDLG